MPSQFYQGRRRGDLGLPGRMPNLDEMLGASGEGPLASRPTVNPPQPQPQQVGPTVGDAPGPLGGPVGGGGIGADVRSMASDQYRDAILRRLGGVGGGMPVTPGAMSQGGPGLPGALAMAAPQTGSPPGQDMNALQSLLRTRPSRRVLRGKGNLDGNLPQ